MYSAQALMDTINNLDVDWTLGSHMDLNPMAYIASNVSWLQNIYRSVDAFYRQPLYCDDEGNVDIASRGTWQQLQLINSTQFLTSLIRVYKAYALEMSRPTSQIRNASQVGNLTSVPFTLIISPGDVPPHPVLALLAIWAVCCSGLGVIYGPRRRWSETLDGFSMFRFGADSAHLNKTGNIGGSTRHFAECPGLMDLPGLVGDSRPDREVGHITLIDQSRGSASRKKKYL
jgi:hypothetical protein